MAKDKGTEGTESTEGTEGTESKSGARESLFTEEQQKHVDRILQERLARVKSEPPADYAELKAQAAELSKLKEAQMSDAEKATARIAELEQLNAATALKAQEVSLRAAIVTEAAGKLADPSDAFSLIDRSSLTFDENGNPTNVADAVASLLEKKPHLAASRALGDIEQGARGTKVNGVEQLNKEQLATLTPSQVRDALKKGQLAGLLGGSK